MYRMGVNTGMEIRVRRCVLYNMLANIFNHYSCCVLRICREQELSTYCKTQ